MSLRAYGAAGLAFVTCPCHVPLVIAVAGGTTFGAVLTAYKGPVIGALAGLFAVSAYFAWRWWPKESSP